MVLDVCSAQPLRLQDISAHQHPAKLGGEVCCWVNKVKGVDSLIEEHSVVAINPDVSSEVTFLSGCSESEFPPIQTGRIKDIRKNFEFGTNSSPSPSSKKKQGTVLSIPQQEVLRETTSPKISMAEMLKRAETKPTGREPVNFNKDNLKKMGIVTISEGRPALVFSCEDTKYLADQMGLTIVGKFSHSIPSSTQIQTALSAIKFKGSFSWRYINAKHIAIRVEDSDDYATLLIGSNGMPMWFIDHHPMRVFKWTTEFDPFFETPIAAVWCNIIGLPIHLFDKSALYAIGRLLGTPIQLDHATANQSRLSFARLCIEIDISKATNEEIVLDIGGKEYVYKVVWDKIPPYCRDCQHVGHVSAKCKAFGKGEHTEHSNNNQGRRSGGNFSYQQKHQGARGPFGEARKDQPKGKKETNQNHQATEANRNNYSPQNFKWRERNQHNKEFGKATEIDEEGFMKQGKRREHKHNQEGLFRTISTGDLSRGKGIENSTKDRQTANAEREAGILAQHRKEGRGRKQEEELMRFAKPSYYQQLENGEFTTGDTDCEDDMEEDPGSALIIHQVENQNSNTKELDTEQALLLEYNKENDRGETSLSHSTRI